MKQDFIELMDRVLAMRRAQKAYFDAVDRRDHTSATKYRSEAITKEREVDVFLSTRGAEIKFGEQKQLFR